MRTLFDRLPVWVRWGVIPVLILLVFGSLIMSVLGFLINLLFKVLIVVALLAMLVFMAKKITSRS